MNLPQSLTVWFVTDNKAGHRSQLLGLEQALSNRCRLNNSQLDSQWLSIEEGWQQVRQQWLSPTLPNPDWLIGAGRLTHLPVLLLKWRFRCRGMVLSKPVWPLGLFNLVALPRHDGVSARHNLMLTEGSINPVLPAEKPEAARGLILIGGPSAHFDWDGDALAHQIEQVVTSQPQISWTLSDSRRTPDGFLQRLQLLIDTTPSLQNLSLISVNDTQRGWVAQQLQHCETVWVGEDSVSMVYESLSAGARVGLLQMPHRGRGVSRVAGGVASLAERKLLTRFSDYQAGGYCNNGPREPLQEADRVAVWMLERIAAGQC